MRDLLARRQTDPHAAEALESYCYQARKWIGALAAVMGGLNTLVFSAGIGENIALIRRWICEPLHFLGIELDAARNDAHEAVISTDASPITVRVIPTDEQAVIVRIVRRLSQQ
jgi:acetate kinase